jgi:hypothetical protein
MRRRREWAGWRGGCLVELGCGGWLDRIALETGWIGMLGLVGGGIVKARSVCIAEYGYDDMDNAIVIVPGVGVCVVM